MTTWMMVLALAAATDGANARARLAAGPAAPQVVVAQEDTPRMAAEASQWTYLGPDMATIVEFEISPTDPDHMLVANTPFSTIPHNSQMLETRSGGEQWQPIEPLRDVQGLVGFMADGRAVVARNGVFSQAPGASTWTHHPRPGAGTAFSTYHMAISRPDGTVWVAGEENFQLRVFRIDDLDATWTDVTPAGLDRGGVHAIAPSPTTPGLVAMVFSRPGHDGMRTAVSTDGGNTWQENETVTGIGNTDVRAFEMQGDSLYLVASFHTTSHSLYRSDDLGASWKFLHWDSGPSAFDLAFDPRDTSRLWVATPSGVWHSTDGGDTLERGDHRVVRSSAGKVVFDASRERLWVAIQFYGVWMSEDGGETFERHSRGLNTLSSASVSIDPRDPAGIALMIAREPNRAKYAMTSPNGGLGWHLPFHPSGRTATRAIYGDDGAMYMAFASGQTLSVYRRPAGTFYNWPRQVHAWDSGAAYTDALDLALGRDPGTLLLSARRFDDELSPREPGIHRYNPSHGAWSLVLEGMTDGRGFNQLERIETATGVRLLAHETSTLGQGHSRLFGSDDDGLTWSGLHDGLPAWNEGLLCLGDEGRVRLLLEEAGVPRLYRSEDAGSTWSRSAWTATALQAAGTPFTSIHCPEDTQQVFLGDQQGNLWQSTDGGDSFDALVGDTETWGPVVPNDVRSSIVGLYVATSSGLWVNTALARPSQAPTSLGVTMESGRMRSLARLAWEGGRSRVEIRRNGASVAEVSNTGRFIDSMLTPLRPLELQWQICNAGTEECSDVVSH